MFKIKCLKMFKMFKINAINTKEKYFYIPTKKKFVGMCSGKLFLTEVLIK